MEKWKNNLTNSLLTDFKKNDFVLNQRTLLPHQYIPMLFGHWWESLQQFS